MNFYFTKTFQDSLAKLDGQSQGLAKQAVFDFQMDPARPSFKFHRVDKALDNFWSARVNDDIRLIVYKDGENMLLSYVAHHDKAYDWAERRKLKPHPTTGAAQFVEVVEKVEEIVRTVVTEIEEEPPIFDKYESDYLLALGVPEEWLAPLRYVGETAFFRVVDQLPEEAAERLFALAAGQPVPIPTQEKTADPLEHPDAQRRFRKVVDDEELRAALDAPWDQWIVFLHPDQRSFVERQFNGPAYVSGSAGTGKTVVALHRTAFLVRENPEAHILLTTFSKTLAARLAQHLALLMGPGNMDRVRADHLHRLAYAEYAKRWGKPNFTKNQGVLRKMIGEAASAAGGEFSANFLESEWTEVIDAHGIRSWDDYKNAPRVGRGTPLGRKQRHGVWEVMQRVLDLMASENLVTWNEVCFRVASALQQEGARLFDHVVVDESQDFGRAELELVKSLVPRDAASIFLAGDSGQRIYKRSFSWRAVGIEVVGRSRRLKINYRTTEQIRGFADSVLPHEVAEHGDLDARRDAVSVLSGPEPELFGCRDLDEERATLTEWILEQIADGYEARDIGIFTRTAQAVEGWIAAAVEEAGCDFQLLRDDEALDGDLISIGTMHRAKGLEFKTVAVVGCSNSDLPYRKVLGMLSDPSDKNAFVEQERSLFYVACTRARDRLRISYSGPKSEFVS